MAAEADPTTPDGAEPTPAPDPAPEQQDGPLAEILQALDALSADTVGKPVRLAAVADIRDRIAALVEDLDEPPKVIDASHANTKLALRIAEAMINAGRVTKSRENVDQHYKFASAEDMLKAVRRPLFERGIILIQHPSPEGTTESTITSRGGNAGTRVVLTSDFEFLDGHSGETLRIDGWTGEGQDYGDKAYGKARTNLLKTFIRAQWLLPTDDDTDPEATPSGDRVPANTTAAWAQGAPKPRKQLYRDSLAPVVGLENADEMAKGMVETWGVFPDGIVAFAVQIGQRYAALNGVTSDPQAAEAARRAQDREAERPDVPAGEAGFTGGLVDGEMPPEDAGFPIDEEEAEREWLARVDAGEIDPDDAAFAPAPTDGPKTFAERLAIASATAAQRAEEAAQAPKPGSIEEPPAIAKMGDPAGRIMALREIGCICQYPLTPDKRDPACPVDHVPF